MAAVDTKRGYVGMGNGRSAQQESGAASSKNSMFTAGALNYWGESERAPTLLMSMEIVYVRTYVFFRAVKSDWSILLIC